MSGQARGAPDQQAPEAADTEGAPTRISDAEEGRLTGSASGDIFPSPDAQAGSGGTPEAAETDPLTRAMTERDDYLDALRRLQADFENYRKRMARAQSEQGERAAGDLVSRLLPVLDTLDMALAHLAGTDAATNGDPAAEAAEAASLAQVGCALTEVLTRAGLERIDPQGQAFDPTEHDAVVLDSEGDAAESEVTEVLRAGYRWKGRVLRPAMVKVKG